MTPRLITFGAHLKQFALSVDFIGPEQYGEAGRLTQAYLKHHLKAVQVAFYTATPVTGKPGIQMEWSEPKLVVNEELVYSESELKELGREGAPIERAYRRQLNQALGERRSLWVVSDTQQPLGKLPDGTLNNGTDYREPTWRTSCLRGKARLKTASRALRSSSCATTTRTKLSVFCLPN